MTRRFTSLPSIREPSRTSTPGQPKDRRHDSKAARSPPDSGAMVYLVNALSFDGEWAEKYKAERVHEDTFTTEEGEEQRVEFLFSDEGTYLAGEHTTGFMKSYKGGDYAFVALLPEEGMSMAEWLRGIDGEQLYELLENRQETSVGTAMPKFSVAYSAEQHAI